MSARLNTPSTSKGAETGPLSLWPWMVKAPVPRPLTTDVVAEVADKYGFTAEQIRGARGSNPVTRARQEVMWILHVQLGRSSTIVGRALRRDHTTVLYGAVQHAKRLAEAAAA